MHGKERRTLTVLITNSDRIVLSRITSYCIRQKKKRATIKTNLVQMINDICKTATFSVFVRDKWNVNSKYTESYNTASHIWYLPLWLWHLEVECMIILPVEDNYWFKKGQLQLLSQEKTTIERLTRSSNSIDSLFALHYTKMCNPSSVVIELIGILCYFRKYSNTTMDFCRLLGSR